MNHCAWPFQEIVLDFFKEHLMAYLDTTFVNKQTFDLDMYEQVMEFIFLVELNNSPRYKESLNLMRFLEWFDYKVSYVVFNCIQ
jgi:hypothetical protein